MPVEVPVGFLAEAAAVPGAPVVVAFLAGVAEVAGDVVLALRAGVVDVAAVGVRLRDDEVVVLVGAAVVRALLVVAVGMTRDVLGLSAALGAEVVERAVLAVRGLAAPAVGVLGEALAPEAVVAVRAVAGRVVPVVPVVPAAAALRAGEPAALATLPERATLVVAGLSAMKMEDRYVPDGCKLKMRKGRPGWEFDPDERNG